MHCPKSSSELPDDLAWMMRKNDGFCRGLMPQKEFA
jgi:hypothetical protein